MTDGIQYRPEIDGLRTIAVLGVIIYHLNPESLKGGFLGVDVFFVISGYLITSIIHRGILERRFSFWSFWNRRFKRLYPALSIVVILTMVVGFFVLPNPEREALPMQALGALFSFSNILLWRTTGGYWSSSSENISLLHTWSLSLEEQFYICFPIFLFLVSVVAKKRLGLATVLLFISSLFLSVTFSYTKPTPAFYLLPTRMWELLIGSLLAIYSPYLLKTIRSSTQATLIHLLGIVLIVVSYFLIENERGFPGIYPLAPCIGAYLILAFPCKSSLVTQSLTLAPVVYIGKISYALYLWHWPIITYAYYISPEPNKILILSTTFALSSISYHYVEKPIREAPRLPRLPTFASALAIVICILSLLIFPRSPLLKELGDFDSKEAWTRGWEFEATDRILAEAASISVKPEKKSIVVLGSSHARVLSAPIKHYAEQNDYEFVSLASSGVGITTKNFPDRPYAAEINRKRIEIVSRIHPDILVIAGMWSNELVNNDRLNALKEFLTDALTVSDQVFFIAQMPLIELPDRYRNELLKFIVANHLSGRSESFNLSQLVTNANLSAEQIIHEIDSDRLYYVDATELFKDTEGNLSLYHEEMGFLYSDYHHINDQGANLIFDSYLRPLISQTKEDSNNGMLSTPE